jgi:hypothetical protein
MSFSWMGAVCASGYGARTTPSVRIDLVHHHSVFVANIPGRMNVQAMPDCSMATSTARCCRAIGLCSASLLTTAPDDSNTTCCTPADLAAATNPWTPSGLA